MRSDDDHAAEWARLHRTRPPSGVVGAWIRGSAAVARPLVAAGIGPNAVTVAALVAALAAVALAAIDGWVGPALACGAVVASGVLDSLDGAVAVQAGRTTRAGYLLDSALDRLADAAFCTALAVAVGTPQAAWLAVAATGCSWYLEYVRARASLAAAQGPQDAGGGGEAPTPGERPTRIILTAVGLGLPALALASLVAQVVIVGGSAAWLLIRSLRSL